jgi:hypothetical protein
VTPKEPIRDLLAALDGASLPGGCDDCDAYQTVETEGGGVTVLTVHHDAACPRLDGGSRDAGAVS